MNITSRILVNHIQYWTEVTYSNSERVTGTQMEREMERCGNAKISVELEHVLNKNVFY